MIQLIVLLRSSKAAVRYVLFHVYFSSLSVYSKQQSAHAKQATEDMEVVILKTCQSVNDLRREVSSCPVYLQVSIDKLCYRRTASLICRLFFVTLLISQALCHWVISYLLFSSAYSVPTFSDATYSPCITPPYTVPSLLMHSFSSPVFLQLHKVAVSRASDLLKVHGEQLPLRALKAAGAEGNLEAVAEYSRTLTEQKEQLVEVGHVDERIHFSVQQRNYGIYNLEEENLFVYWIPNKNGSQEFCVTGLGIHLFKGWNKNSSTRGS